MKKVGSAINEAGNNRVSVDEILEDSDADIVGSGGDQSGSNDSYFLFNEAGEVIFAVDVIEPDDVGSLRFKFDTACSSIKSQSVHSEPRSTT